VVVPAATPKPVIAKLHADIVGRLNQSDVRSRLEAQGVEVVGSTPSGFDRFIRDEIARWGKAVKLAGAKPD
jgi:tripartite-type tricarboxylate transporter receptor subunit TctC